MLFNPEEEKNKSISDKNTKNSKANKKEDKEKKNIKKNQKNWTHPLFKQNPLEYTQRGKLRNPNNGRFTPGTKQKHRTGATPQKILDFLIGGLLGDASGELYSTSKTPIFSFKQSVKHAEYLYYLYLIFLYWGYTSLNVPLPTKTKDGAGNTHEYLRFRTFAIPSLSWIYYMFYPNGLKVVPHNIGDYFNSRVLAVWIMDDGSWVGSGILLHCNSFSLSDVQRLVELLKDKFQFKASIRAKGNNHIIYIHAESIPALRNLVKPHMIKFFYYKLGIK